MIQNSSTTCSPSVGNNSSLFNEDVANAVSATVSITLHKNVGSWIRKGYINLDDFTQNAILHILNKSDSFNPDYGTSFQAWACTVAHNYAISESKKLKRIVENKTRLDLLDGYEIPDGDSTADPFKKVEDSLESDVRMKKILDFFHCLNESDQLLLNMMMDGLTKIEMMKITHKNGGTIDTNKSRLRTKILRYIKTLY